MATPAKLPLAARKELRDQQANIDAALAQIAAALGLAGPLTLEYDDAAVLKVQADGGYENRMGEILASFTSELASKIQKFAADDLVKQELVAAFTSNKVTFAYVPADKISSYHHAEVSDGVLKMTVRETGPWSNVGDMANDLVGNIHVAGGTPQISLLTRKNLSDNESKRDVHLAAIASAIGFTGKATLEADLADWEKELEVNGYSNRLGEILYDSWLENLASRIVGDCKDDMVQEEYLDHFSSGVVLFKLTDARKSYFEGGKLVIEIKHGSPWSNVSDIANDLQSTI